MLLQLPWVDADVIKKISRKGGARSVAELMRMGEQERLELFVTSGRGGPLHASVLFLRRTWHSAQQSPRLGVWTSKEHVADVDVRCTVHQSNCFPVICSPYTSEAHTTL